MELQEFLALIIRKFVILATIVIATVVATLVVYFQTPAQTTTTLIYSVSVSDTKGAKDSFNTTGIADDFVRTVAGWTQSPTFSEKIGALADTALTLSGSAQAKQNLLVTTTFSDRKSADKITSAVGQTLREAITRYNTNSYFKFALTDYGATTTSARPSLMLAVLSAGVGGGVLALGLILLWSYFSGTVLSVASAEALLRVSAVVVFRCSRDPALRFVDALIQKLGKNTVLVGVDFDPKKIVERLQTKITTLKLPAEMPTLTREKVTPIVLVKLDQTKIETLRALRSLHEGELRLVIWA